MVFLPLSSVSLTELCSVWYGLKDLFTLHKLAGKIGQNFQNAWLRMWAVAIKRQKHWSLEFSAGK